MKDRARSRDWSELLMDGPQPRCPVCAALYGFLVAFTTVVSFGAHRPKRALTTCSSHYCRDRARQALEANGPITNDEVRSWAQ